jgi:hypothetical protein
MKYLVALLLLLSSTFAKSQNCIKDSIINDFVNGKLLLINQLSIVNTNDAFFSKLLSMKFTYCEMIGPDKGKEMYGTMGENGVISIELSNLETLRGEYVDLVDASVLKFFHEEDAVFYHTDGIPNRDMFMALNTLLNKKIEKVDLIEKAEARAIWGDQAKNGAVMITCNRSQRLTLFSR